MVLSKNYFNALIVPKTDEDSVAARALKNAIHLYIGMPFTTHEIYPHIQEESNVPARNVSNAVLRLANAGILQVAGSDGEHDTLYMPLNVFDPEKSYMDIVLTHAIETNGIKPDKIAREPMLEKGLISDTGIVHTSYEEPTYSASKRLLMDDLGVLKPKKKSGAQAVIDGLYGLAVAEIGVDGNYRIGILNNGASGAPSLGPINPHGKIKVWLTGTEKREDAVISDTYASAQDPTFAPISRENVIFALQCTGIGYDVAKKYIPEDACFKR